MSREVEHLVFAAAYLAVALFWLLGPHHNDAFAAGALVTSNIWCATRPRKDTTR